MLRGCRTEATAATLGPTGRQPCRTSYSAGEMWVTTRAPAGLTHDWHHPGGSAGAAHAGPLPAGLSSSRNSLTQQAPRASREEGKGGCDWYPCSPSSRDAVMPLVLLWPGELECGRVVPGWAGARGPPGPPATPSVQCSSRTPADSAPEA